MRDWSDDGVTRAFRIAGFVLMIVALAFFTEEFQDDRGGASSVVQVLGLVLAAYWGQVALTPAAWSGGLSASRRPGTCSASRRRPAGRRRSSSRPTAAFGR